MHLGDVRSLAWRRTSESESHSPSKPSIPALAVAHFAFLGAVGTLVSARSLHFSQMASQERVVCSKRWTDARIHTGLVGVTIDEAVSPANGCPSLLLWLLTGPGSGGGDPVSLSLAPEPTTYYFSLGGGAVALVTNLALRCSASFAWEGAKPVEAHTPCLVCGRTKVTYSLSLSRVRDTRCLGAEKPEGPCVPHWIRATQTPVPSKGRGQPWGKAVDVVVRTQEATALHLLRRRGHQSSDGPPAIGGKKKEGGGGNGRPGREKRAGKCCHFR